MDLGDLVDSVGFADPLGLVGCVDLLDLVGLVDLEDFVEELGDWVDLIY